MLYSYPGFGFSFCLETMFAVQLTPPLESSVSATAFGYLERMKHKYWHYNHVGRHRDLRIIISGNDLRLRLVAMERTESNA